PSSSVVSGRLSENSSITRKLSSNRMYFLFVRPMSKTTVTFISSCIWFNYRINLSKKRLTGILRVPSQPQNGLFLRPVWLGHPVRGTKPADRVPLPTPGGPVREADVRRFQRQPEQSPVP